MSSLPAFLSKKVIQVTKPSQNPLASFLVRLALDRSKSSLPLSTKLAASFDLVVASKFYQYVKPEGWLWCKDAGKDYYPFLNACPYCVYNDTFVHFDGHKPPSGQIGPVTALAFRELLASYFDATGKSCSVYNASEPIDLMVVDWDNKRVFVAEVKAGPLFVPPLTAVHTADSMDTTAVLPLHHSKGTARKMDTRRISMFIPSEANIFEIPLSFGVLGTRHSVDLDISLVLAENESLALEYFKTWSVMWQANMKRDKTARLFWFVGGCGRPKHCGEGWPINSSGVPEGTVSDNKTSVGMDRTDDIKKATFQALTLGVDYRRRQLDGWELMTGIASNLHAVRHEKVYLEPYETLVWKWADGDQFHNLFDGVVTFTKSVFRNPALQLMFDWR